MRVWERIMPVLFFVICSWVGAALATANSLALQQLQEDINQAVAVVRPSVVSIRAEKKVAADSGQGSGFIWYESIGSGFIVDDRGFVLSNYHVVEDAKNITVRLWRPENNTFPGRVVDADASLDLVLLRIDANDLLTPADLGDAERLEVGDWVLSVGSPFGFEHSVSRGIVSDLHRDLMIGGKSYRDMIQTDAVINQGNSGGPLVDVYGRVVGVGTAIYAPEGTYRGIGFAIPINRARHFFTRATGAKLVALARPATPPAAEKEPINLNNRMPNDAAHQKFADCTQCHTIAQKSVVSLKADMTHPIIGPCDKCHIMVKDRVTRGLTTVAAVGPVTDGIHQSDTNRALVLVLRSLLLIFFGIGVGTFGTMLGVGSGWIHVPFLMLLFHFSPQTAIGTSIGIIFWNTLSGSIVYGVQKRMDFDLARKLAVAVIPGALLGPFLVQHFKPASFSIIFALIMGPIAAYLFFKKNGPIRAGVDQHFVTSHKTSANVKLGIVGTVLIGFTSNLVGIGGGIIHVPFLILALQVPTHISLGTSHLILCVSSAVGTLVYFYLGYLQFDFMMPIAAGTIIGAPLGAALAKRADEALIRRLLAALVLLLAIKMATAGMHYQEREIPLIHEVPAPPYYMRR